MKLDNNHKLIKNQVDMMYDLIQTAEKALLVLRKQCNHPYTEIVDYMWAPGHITPNTKVCKVCSKVCGKVLVELFK